MNLPAAPSRTPAEWEKSRPLVVAGLAELRHRKIAARAHAMCDGAEYVLGIRCTPLTLKTYSLLLAHRSRFFTGGPIGEGDVRNYLWFHSPLYVGSDVPGWERRKRRALRAFTWALTQPVATWMARHVPSLRVRPTRERYAAAMALAITDIRAHIEAAFADAARGSGREAPPASLHAQFVHAFAHAYHWPAEYTENIPLRKLFQLDRAMAASCGAALRDEDEDALLDAHLARRQAEIDAARAAAAVDVDAAATVLGLVTPQSALRNPQSP